MADKVVINAVPLQEDAGFMQDYSTVSYLQ